MSLEEAQRLLKAEGVDSVLEGDVLFATFQGSSSGSRRLVALLSPDKTGYYTILSSVGKIDVGAIEKEALWAAIAASSQTRLAKLEVLLDRRDGRRSLVAATSECSVDAPTGRKLFRRAAACAELAEKLTEVLKPYLGTD